MDIKTSLITPQRLDWSLSPSGLAADDDLASAVLIALFTDARVDGQRGWWGDAYPDDGAAGRRTAGSRLWLLERGKQTLETLRAAETYAEEALAWLVDDGLARRVTATAHFPGRSTLALAIEIEKATGQGGGVLQLKIDDIWRDHAL